MTTPHPHPALHLQPMTVHVPEEAITDLNQRLSRTRFAAAVAGDDWSAGTPADYLHEMLERWQSFHWRAVEEQMNAWPNFLTEIEGQTIHFQHIRSKHDSARPLLLAHTYPGSFHEFADLIAPLTDPTSHGGTEQDAFHLVIPSMPGFAFSTPLSDGQWTIARVARTWDTLMRGLGYATYGVHGSDVGAMVGRELAILNPVGFHGAHVLQLFSFPSGDPAEFEKLSPEDYQALEFAQWFTTVNGYATMNASRPNTIAAALSDSPVGQLAYNELFNNFGNGTSLVAPDQILAQVSLYWLTNTSASAVRYHHTERGLPTVVNEGPIGVTVFADDFKSIRAFAERDNTNIVSWTERPRGGHFAALEAPDALVEEIRHFFGHTR